MRLLKTHLKTCKNISVFLNNVIGKSDFWEVLFLFNLLISFIIFSLSTSSKVNFGFFYFPLISMILAWLLYFKIAWKTGVLTFSKLELRFSYSAIFTFFTIFKNKSLSTLLLINYPFSMRWILSLFIDLSDRRGLTFFQFVFAISYVLLI